MAETLAGAIGPAARAAVEFTARPDFTLNEGDSPSLVYLRVRDRVQGARRAELLRRNISCPEDLGLLLNPAEDRMREAIAVADLADRVLGALLEANVRQVEVFRPGEAEYVTTGEAEGAEGSKAAEDAPCVRRLPLRFAVAAPLGDVQALLVRFQRAGSCLEVAAARVSRLGTQAGAGPDGGLLRAELEVAALTLVPAAEARLAGSKTAAPANRRGLTPRGGSRR